MKTQLIHGLKSGLIYGIIMLFIMLIGFLSVIAELLSQVIKIDLSAAGGLTIPMVNLILFMGFMGTLAGNRGGNQQLRTQGSLAQALAGGVASGLSFGLVMGITAGLFSAWMAAGIQLTKYLSAMLPPVVRLFTYERPPFEAFLLHFSVLLVGGAVGGLLNYAFNHSALKTLLPQWRSSISERITNLPLVKTARASKWTGYIFYGILMVFVLVMPLFIGQYWNYTLGTVGIYFLLGLGLNIVVGMAGLLNLGYVAFFAIGAYTVALMTAPEPHNLQANFWIALLLGIVFAALTGILLGVPVLRLRGDYLAIVTLGFGEIIRVLSRSDLLNDFTGGPRGVRDIGGPTLFGQPFDSDINFLYIIILSCLLIIFVTNRLQNSRIGRAWVAMREDETVAQAMGINTMRYKLLAFAIGAAFAGLGGVLFASRNQFTGPEDHNLMVSINVLALLIVGGMNSVPGIIAGAFVLKGLPEVLRQLDSFRILAFGALLVIMMIWRPEGLIPSSRRMLESKPDEPPPPELPVTDKPEEPQA